MMYSGWLGRLVWTGTMLVICLLGIGLMALLILSPQRALANLLGEQPLSIRSGLHADYSADDRAFVVAPVEMRIVEEAIRDEITQPAQPTRRLPVVSTPLNTVIPANPIGQPSATSGQVAARTNTPQAATPTHTPTPINSATLKPSLTGATSTLTLTKPATFTPGVGPNLTPLPSSTNTSISIPPTNTLISVPPTRTFTPHPPTNTVAPARTNTPAGYPPPGGTPIPTRPYP